MTSEIEEAEALIALREALEVGRPRQDRPRDGRPQMTSKTEKEKIMTPQAAITFLEAASRYFEKRPTKGEDAAVWSNATNAANCKAVAKLVHDLSKTAKRFENVILDVGYCLDDEGDKVFFRSTNDADFLRAAVREIEMRRAKLGNKA